MKTKQLVNWIKERKWGLMILDEARAAPCARVWCGCARAVETGGSRLLSTGVRERSVGACVVWWGVRWALDAAR